jgi:hypothetical protein
MIQPARAREEAGVADADFRSSLKFSVGMFLFLALIVAIQVFVGTTATLLTLIPFTILICYFGYQDPFKGVMVYLCFFSVEGMYRYLTRFAQWEYLLSPTYALILTTIFLGRGRLVAQAGRRLPALALFLGAIIIGVMAIFNPLGIGITGSVATFTVWYLIPMVMYPLVYFVKKRPGDAYLFCLILVVVGVTVSLVQMLQYTQGKAWTEAKFPGIEKTMDATVYYTNAVGASKTSFRPAATTSTGGGGGMWARLCVLSAFVLFAILDRRFVTRAVLLLVGMIGIMGVFLCGVRIAFIFVIADLIFWSLYSATGFRVLRKSLVLLVVGFVLMRISFSVSESMTGGFVSERFEKLFEDPVAAYQSNRQRAIPNAILTATNYPLGIGYSRGTGTRGEFEGGKFGPGIGDRESQFGAYVADLGIPGLLVYVSLVGVLIYSGVRQTRRLKGTSESLIACIGPSLLSGGFVVWFGASIMSGNAIYWIAMGMTFSLTETELLERERRRRVWESQKQAALTPATGA